MQSQQESGDQTLKMEDDGLSGWDLATAGSKVRSIATPAVLQLLYKLNLHFNEAFHNIWQFKPVNMSTVEVGGQARCPLEGQFLWF